MDSNTELSTDLAPSLLWFRQDLRLNDNPALNAALKTGRAGAGCTIHSRASMSRSTTAYGF